ncbi:RNA polymerase sigma factor [Aureicoccus marinus]|uniref:RNA polymerase sigma factor n=1 Tax=Aureicoccus marinus TaxID=754435 RepID=A0A2S7T593_9FLAO|nr:RNA polymerase sigma factor [Aureicoccus marinus]PQJ14655.1 RNA polymerase subunit sigma-70 [Aureicoccus marinus]
MAPDQSLLLQQCREHNPKAQMQLYRQYAEGMFHVAIRYVDRPADAEDIVQESFIKAFDRLHQFEGQVSFGAWLKRIVVNRSLDWIRSRREVVNEWEENEVIDLDQTNDWEVDSTVSLERVEEAIKRLPEKYREVVLLYLVEGYDHEEISEIIKISPSNSRARLARGRQKLKKMLEKSHYGTGS